MSYMRVALYGEQGAGKTWTSGTLTPGRDTCVIRTQPMTQYLVHDKTVRIQPTSEKPYSLKEFLTFLENPEKLFGIGIRTLVIDDFSTIEIVGLDDAGMVGMADKRQAYHQIQSELFPAILNLAAKPLNLVVITQAKKSVNEFTGVTEIDLDLHNKLGNVLLGKMDYCFFVNKNKEFGKPPSLTLWSDKKILTKLRLLPSQFSNPPVQKEEPADLAAIWKKLTGVVQ